MQQTTNLLHHKQLETKLQSPRLAKELQIVSESAKAYPTER